MDVKERRKVEANNDGRQTLSREACLALLATESIGRLGASFGALPIVLPAVFVVIDEDIVFRTNEEAKLLVAAHRAVVAFEAGRFDADGVGWTAVVQDVARVTHVDEFASAPGIETLASWKHWPTSFVGVVPTANIAGRWIA